MQREVLAFVALHGVPGIMPSRLLFESHDRADLVNIIYRKFGGLRPLARRLHLSMGGRNAERQWSSITVLRAEVKDFARINGTANVMPSGLELRRHGRADLLAAIIREGGLAAVGTRCKMRLRPELAAAKPDLREFELLRDELLAFIRANATAGFMPRAAELRALGRSDLLAAMHAHHGGQLAVAARLGLVQHVAARSTSRAVKPPGYWAALPNLERELLTFAARTAGRERQSPTPAALVAAAGAAPEAEGGVPEDAARLAPLMPMQRELLIAGRSDLHRAIAQHGGYFKVGQLLGLRRADGRVHRRWADFAVVQAELLSFIAANGTAGVMPTHVQLQLAGRSDLLSAIARHHGSMHLVAERTGLVVADGYAFRDWLEFENLAREVRAFIAQSGGAPGVMPTSLELRKAGRYDLHCAVQLHRGFFNVARRLSLHCDGGYDVPGSAAGSASALRRGAYGASASGARGSQAAQAAREREEEHEGAAGDAAAHRAEEELMRALLAELDKEEAGG